MEPVIVIHGTFANEATWWRPEGSFCRLLDTQLKQKGSEARCWDSIPSAEAISEFGWSGLNSEASRTHAAKLLSTKIQSLSQRPHIKKIHFVAHSHGGNVLLKSFLLCRREIDNQKLGTVVFLGTPFLEYSSVSPKGRQRVGTISDIDSLGKFFVIHSKHDEAYHLLSKAIHFRSSAYAYSQRLGPPRSGRFGVMTRRSGISAPPRSLSTFTLLKLRQGRFGVMTRRSKALAFTQSFLPRLAVLYLKYGVLLIYIPFISLAKRWGQRWGIYFGIKALVSAALGDDLGFEQVLSVKRSTSVVPTKTIELGGRIEEAILSSVVSGTDEVLVRLYRSISVLPPEFKLESLVDSISGVFRAQQIVHSQYYQNPSVIEIIASAICGRLSPDAPDEA
jgi:hypothetical protein